MTNKWWLIWLGSLNMSLFESGWVMLTQKFQDCVILSWLMISWILVCFHNMARFYWMIKYWSNASSSHWIGPLKFSLFMPRVNPCDYINRPPDWNELYLFTRNCFYRIICLIIFDPWFQHIVVLFMTQEFFVTGTFQWSFYWQQSECLSSNWN